MTDEQPKTDEWNSTNLWEGVQRLRERRAPAIMRDVRPIDFEYQTEARIDFLTGYIDNLIKRIEKLEAEADVSSFGGGAGPFIDNDGQEL